MSNPFASYAEDAIPRVVQRRQARAEERVAKRGTALERRMDEKRRLSASYRRYRRQWLADTLRAGPSPLPAFLRWVKRVGSADIDSFIAALAGQHWLLSAHEDVRLLVLRSISRQCDRIAIYAGGEPLSDPLPQQPANLFFLAKPILGVR